MQVKIKKHSENATIPTYAKFGDAGLDFTATKIIKESEGQITYDTDISIELSEGYVALVFPRSSIRNYDLQLSNSVGVIDSGYRGTLQATFNKTKINACKYDIGDRIFQLLILPYPQIEFIESEELSKTERGDGGFGHSGL